MVENGNTDNVVVFVCTLACAHAYWHVCARIRHALWYLVHSSTWCGHSRAVIVRPVVINLLAMHGTRLRCARFSCVVMLVCIIQTPIRSVYVCSGAFTVIICGRVFLFYRVYFFYVRNVIENVISHTHLHTHTHTHNYTLCRSALQLAIIWNKYIFRAIIVLLFLLCILNVCTSFAIPICGFLINSLFFLRLSLLLLLLSFVRLIASRSRQCLKAMPLI